MAENQTEQLTHGDTPSSAGIGTSCVIVYVPTGNTGFATALDRQLSEVGAQELRHLFYEHLSDWSEPGAVEINRNGKLLELVSVLRKWERLIPWARPKR